jgi:hypothetical protein
LWVGKEARAELLPVTLAAEASSAMVMIRSELRPYFAFLRIRPRETLN